MSCSQGQRQTTSEYFSTMSTWNILFTCRRHRCLTIQQRSLSHERCCALSSSLRANICGGDHQKGTNIQLTKKIEPMPKGTKTIQKRRSICMCACAGKGRTTKGKTQTSRGTQADHKNKEATYCEPVVCTQTIMLSQMTQLR
eukprot:m.47542 g.47542  ORF g.47542 m.47542 type:complete len:142 (+) comp12331_c0_seq1:1307-1732(+)